MDLQAAQAMSRYVVKLSTEGATGLGVITGDHILTCAHYYEYIKASVYGHFMYVDCQVRGDDGTYEYFVQTADGPLDFMVLGQNPIGHEIDNDKARPLFTFEIAPEIKPVRLVPSPDAAACIELPVYFFAPDGKTVIPTTATLRPYSANITLATDEVRKGCSGGPLFTADHQLLGIIQGSFSAAKNTGRASRIDLLASGWLCQKLGDLDDLPLPFPDSATKIS